MKTHGLKAEGVQWNLAELYSGPDDPRIEADLAEARRQAEAFAQKYRGKVADKQSATSSPEEVTGLITGAIEQV